jgi:hypothetical protein
MGKIKYIASSTTLYLLQASSCLISDLQTQATATKFLESTGGKQEGAEIRETFLEKLELKKFVNRLIELITMVCKRLNRMSILRRVLKLTFKGNRSTR